MALGLSTPAAHLLLAPLILLLAASSSRSDPTPVPPSPTTPTTWQVTEGNRTCILMQAAISLSVNYTDVYNQTHFVELELPPSAKASGSCTDSGSHQQHFVLSWQPDTNSTQYQSLNNTLTVIFQANATSKKNSSINGQVPLGKYAIIQLTAVLHKIPELFPNATNPTAPFIVENQGLVALPTLLNHSFACDSLIKLGPLTSLSPDSNSTLQAIVNLEEFQVEAFRRKLSKSGVFGAAEHCPADEISSGSMVGTVILTISVIVLLALGMAALATYVLKKRRATGGTGYENM